MVDEFYPNIKIIDLSDGKKFKVNFKLKDQCINSLQFIDATKEQIVFSESGSNIIVSVYETTTVAQWQCIEYIGNPMWSDEKHAYRIQKAKYNITNGKHELIEKYDYTYVTSITNIDLDEKTYYALNKNKEYIGLFDNSKMPENLASGIIVPDANLKIGTVTLTNGDKLTENYTIDVVICDKEEKPVYTFESIDKTLVFEPTHQGNTFSGTWLNEKAEGTTSSETFNLGTGINQIVFDTSKNIGKDTVILTKGGTYNLDFINTNSIKYSYVKSGNDIIMQVQKLDGSTWVNNGQMTIKNYFGQGRNVTITSNDKGFDEKTITGILNEGYDKRNKKSSQNITDTFLNETIYGGEAADNIKSVGGDDLINAGRGNDKISLSGGIKSLCYYKGDGNDTITATNGTVLDFRLLDIPIYVDYQKINNDLKILAKDNVLSSNYDYTITVKNYFNKNAGILIKDNSNVNVKGIVNYLNSELYNKENLTKSQSIKDTFLDGEKLIGGYGNDTITIVGGSNEVYGKNGNDSITVNGDDDDINKIYGGEGNDNINIQSGYSNYVWGGNGNDTITSKGSEDYLYGGSGKDKITSSNGNATIRGGEDDDTISVSNGSKKLLFYAGDGHDTISIGKNAEVEILLDQGKAINGVIYSKSGNDLVIYRQESKIDTLVYPDTSDSITIKNCFNNTYDITLCFRLPGMSPQNNYRIKLNPTELPLRWYGSDEKKNTINASKYNDYIYAGTMTNKISAGDGKNYIYQSKAGTDISITAGKDDDKYYIYDMSKTVTINDNGGNDELVFKISKASERHFFFDVTQKNGDFKSCGTDLDIIYKSDDESIEDFISGIVNEKNKVTVTPNIAINNYFTKNGDTGKGCIEILEGADIYNFDEVRENVSAWLYEKGFSSVSQFLKKGAGEDTEAFVKELFSIYDNGFNNPE